MYLQNLGVTNGRECTTFASLRPPSFAWYSSLQMHLFLAGDVTSSVWLKAFHCAYIDHTFLLPCSEAGHPSWFRLSDVVNRDAAITEVQRSETGEKKLVTWLGWFGYS